VVSLSLLSAAPRAFAADGEGPRAPKAAELRIAADRFDEGRAAFKASAFAEAAEHFEAADTHAPSSNALALAMRSRAEAGQYAKAATLAELVLVRHPDNSELVAQAQATISAHSAELSRIDIECKTRCELVIDQKLVHGFAKTEWRVYLDPGRHEVVANFEEEREAVAQTEVVVGQTTTLTLEAPAPTAVPPAEPPKVASVVAPPAVDVTPEKPRHGLPPTVFWIGVGATAVLGGVTVWSGIDTATNPGPDAVREACVGQGSSCPEYQEGRRKQLRTNLLLGGTALMAVATAVTGIFVTDFSRTSSSPQRGAPNWSVRPVASIGLGQAAMLGAEGRF
jgi:hypothetical protein